MAIFGLQEELNLNIEEKENKSITPSFEYDRVNNELKAYIASYKWEVTYFHRNITSDEHLTQFDPDLDPSLQDYNRIDDFELKVDNPITGDTNYFTGSAFLDADFIPNPNDVFIAKILDGKSILFQVRSVEKNDYNNDRIFKILFELYAEIAGEDDPIIVTLLNSTVNEFVYNKDYRKTRTQPLYKKEEVNDRQTFYKILNGLMESWNRDFINPDTNFFIGYKRGNSVVYDPQLETFIRDTIGMDNLNPKVEIVELEDKKISILDYIIKENIAKTRIEKFLYYTYPGDVYKDPYLFSLAYIQVDEFVDVNREAVLPPVNEIVDDYFPKVEDETYVFRKSVYDELLNPDFNLNNITYTKFEQTIIAMMNGSPIDKKILANLTERVYNLEDRERFYFIPILIYVIKYYLTTFTVSFL